MLDDLLELIYKSSVRTQDEDYKTCQKWWMKETNGKKELWKSVLVSQNDDDDDDDDDDDFTYNCFSCCLDYNFIPYLLINLSVPLVVKNRHKLWIAGNTHNEKYLLIQLTFRSKSHKTFICKKDVIGINKICTKRIFSPNNKTVRVGTKMDISFSLKI